MQALVKSVRYLMEIHPTGQEDVLHKLGRLRKYCELGWRLNQTHPFWEGIKLFVIISTDQREVYYLIS